MNSGIYSITCLINGKKYIGSSNDLHKRKNKHFVMLNQNKVKNKKLQTDFNIYGESNFIFEIIEETNNLEERENYWMDYYKTYVPKYGEEYGYNKMKAMVPSEIHREKMSLAHSNKTKSIETREKISKANKGKKRTKESRKNYSNCKKQIDNSILINIYYMIKDGKNQTEIMDVYDISKSTISRIRNGKHWICEEIEKD